MTDLEALSQRLEKDLGDERALLEEALRAGVLFGALLTCCLRVNAKAFLF